MVTLAIGGNAYEKRGDSYGQQSRRYPQ
ncbi:protein of unknown function [Nitrospira japonica]|uniref:Uncharacterized protein n=1 Tax=Nitrospira japonica TaxID=1325564 RepID=A0A1W1I0E2_9BACT|nr:protein of unknown function [Nitrospira japonica]